MLYRKAIKPQRRYTMRIELTTEYRRRVTADLKETCSSMNDASETEEYRAHCKSHAVKLRKFLKQGFVEA